MPAAARLGLDENLADERGDGLDGTRHREEPPRRQARVRKARMDALADGPDLRFPGQATEGLHRVVGHHLVEPADESLIGAEHDGPDGVRVGSPFPSTIEAAGSPSRKQAPRPSSTVR